MSLTQTIGDELKSAMKAKDKTRLETLRSIKSAILLAQTEKGGGTTLSEEDELKILQRLQKQRKDSLEIYEQQGREDLASDEREQLKVINTFLPQPMDEEELQTRLQEIIVRVDAKGPQDMGKVMGVATKELAGKADGKTISAQVRAILSRA